MLLSWCSATMLCCCHVVLRSFAVVLGLICTFRTKVR
jgi:hypothetical protein